MQRGNHFPTFPDRQRGAVLLVFMLIFFLASMSWILSQTDSSRMRSEADKTTYAALAQAKEALIGRAVTDNERPGSLPCPDFDDDGKAYGSCSETIGRLPWRTLDLPDLRDGNGNRLWYALASELRQIVTPAIEINPKLALGLSLDGTTNIAAIVFSVGPPLASQNGRPSNDLDDYLDGANKDGGPYVSGPPSPTFNDKTISISRDQLFSIVNRRILRLFSAGLQKYYAANANYPEMSVDLKTVLKDHLDTDTEEMLEDNDWYEVIKYESYESPAGEKTATLTVDATPATSCTVTPAQDPSCTNP
jgi:hypothetical protein